MPDTDQIPVLTSAILDALERLEKLSTSGDAYALSTGVPLEAARIQGLAALLDALTRQRSTDATRGEGERLATALDRFTGSTNETSRRMVFWTKIMALTSLALVLASIAQIVVVLVKP